GGRRCWAPAAAGCGTAAPRAAGDAPVAAKPRGGARPAPGAGPPSSARLPSGEDDRLFWVGGGPVRRMPGGHRHLPSHRESAGKLTAAGGQIIKTFDQRCQVKSNPKKESPAGRIGGVLL